MIHVIAEIHLKPGAATEYLEIFNANVPAVRSEKGCIVYFAGVDVDADIPTQSLDPDVVTIMEIWRTLEDLHDHRRAPHMLAYKEKVKPLVERVHMKVLRRL